MDLNDVDEMKERGEDNENSGSGKPHQFRDLGKDGSFQPLGNLEALLRIPLRIVVEMGRAKSTVSELLKLGRGSVIELSRAAGEPLDIFANEKLIARGEVVIVGGNYGIRVTEIMEG
jgi:flagellar motor switch protein FliN/FliY